MFWKDGIAQLILFYWFHPELFWAVVRSISYSHGLKGLIPTTAVSPPYRRPKMTTLAPYSPFFNKRQTLVPPTPRSTSQTLHPSSRRRSATFLPLHVEWHPPTPTSPRWTEQKSLCSTFLALPGETKAAILWRLHTHTHTPPTFTFADPRLHLGTLAAKSYTSRQKVNKSPYHWMRFKKNCWGPVCHSYCIFTAHII